MDEILIEEKKYISSKRAAKITGYAKDYIGQLCREGRVQARLIGRSWYVLEAAIQDHRFGNPEIELSPPPISTWEAPRYEASSEELLPALNRLKNTETPADTEASTNNQENVQETSQHLQDSWREWFDHVAEDTDVSGDIVASAISDEETEVKESEEPEIENDTDTEVQVPIHTIYQAPPEELLPRHMVAESPRSEHITTRMRSKGLHKGVIRTIQTTGAMLAVIVAAVAVIGSGYFDTYVTSSSQVMMIAGVALYNR